MSTKESTTNKTISGRIKFIRKHNNLSQAAFAETLGIKQPTLSEIEKGTYPPSASAIRLIVTQYRIRQEWLETGEGEMFQEQKARKLRDVSTPVDVFYLISDAEKRGVATEYQLRWKADFLNWEETRKKAGLLKDDPYCLHDPDDAPEGPSGALSRGRVPADGAAHLLPLNPDDVVVMQVYVTGGAGAPYEFIPSEPIEEIVVPKTYYTRTIVPVKVRGRSMERTLRDGAVVGVDRADRQIVNGELYAVWLPYQGTVIKRLYLDHKKIRLHSDNEEFRSQDVEVTLDEVDDNFIQGRVKWVIQLL